MDWMNEDIRSDVRNWWMSLFLGGVFVLVALCLLFAPVASYMSLTVLFCIAILISGIVEIMFGVTNRKAVYSWGWYIAGGIIDLLIGIYLLSYPVATMEAIPYLIAFWLLFRGFTLCGYATDLSHYKTRGWGWYLSFGILSIICSLILLWQPMVLGSHFPFALAFTLFIMGIFRIIFSFELKHLSHRKERKEHISN